MTGRDEVLLQARRLAAEDEFSAYDFGGKVVEGTGAWDGSATADRWERRFYFESDVDGFDDDLYGVDRNDPACMEGRFVVVFVSGGDGIVEASATHRDLPVGRRGIPEAPRLR